MAIIAQRQLFGWQEIEQLGDLDRLELVLRYLPDEPLMLVLESQRDRGRNDYPVRAVWNSLIAGVVFGHERVASLRRELQRNGQLRQVCGFDLGKGIAAVPSARAYSEFLNNLLQREEEVQQVFDRLVEKLKEVLPGLGKHLALDGKAIASYARRKVEGKTKKQNPGRRRDEDAEWGRHEHSGKREDGSVYTKEKKWFGYTLHLIVDADYELPVGFELTDAKGSEVIEGHRLVDRLAEQHRQLVQGCETLEADRAYDDGKLLVKLWDKYQVAPVIDIRNCWKDGEKSKRVGGTENVVYDYRGTVSCVRMSDGVFQEMAFGGFEKDRGRLKYRCPACHYGTECGEKGECTVGKAVRIPLSEDRRVFTPIARSSYKWQGLYNKRTAVERVNSRLDVSYGFEHHTIRGRKKMKVQCGIGLCVMLAMGLGRASENQQELIRSLVRRA